MGQEHWTDAVLDAMREEMDPIADKVVEAIYASGDLDGVNRLLMHLVRNDSPPSPAVTTLVDEYFANTATLPAWADPAQIEIAEGLFSEHGLLGTAILCCASLPECYLDQRDVPVLASTQQLERHVYRRIWETSHMVITVMQPGGMAPVPALATVTVPARARRKRTVVATTTAAAGPDRARPGEGIRCCQKVRLMHAAIRHLLLADDGPVGAPDHLGRKLAAQHWNKALGLPINQESMAYVILTFSYVGLRGLDTLGVALTGAQREAYIHAWSVIGHVMGVRDELLARNFVDAEFLFKKIKRRQIGPSDDGKALTGALIAWMSNTMPHPFKGLPKELVCELLGPDAAVLGVRLDPEEGVEEGVFAAALRNLTHLASELMMHTPLRRGAEMLFHAIVQEVWDMEKGWGRETFALPPALTKSWRIQKQAKSGIAHAGNAQPPAH